MTLAAAVAELMRRRRVLIGVDFDGTLAPLVAHPDDAVPDDEAIDLLTRLADLPGLTVAVVSGRAHSDLSIRLGPLPGAILVGEHGNDTGADVDEGPMLAQAKALVRDIQAEFGPMTVEEKKHSVTLHTRRLDDAAVEAVNTRVRGWVSQTDGIMLLEGKNVLELTTAGGTKGTAIGDLGRHGDGTLYIGDDTTDETVFTTLGPDDIGVKVGDGPTSARYRVDDVAGVVGVLRAALTGRADSSWHD